MLTGVAANADALLLLSHGVCGQLEEVMGQTNRGRFPLFPVLAYDECCVCTFGRPLSLLEGGEPSATVTNAWKPVVCPGVPTQVS